ncbi:hypothetical protein BV378_24130 [Nostoc sp. RF31YmG]|nr:hypothetical protein BV378_24130 [Nostoc sp. RF31YmG]OUL33967.1 hypothetical protein BV375_06195 [Nostoc sp. 106C]
MNKLINMIMKCIVNEEVIMRLRWKALSSFQVDVMSEYEYEQLPKQEKFFLLEKSIGSKS